jgi:hypothetical protein
MAFTAITAATMSATCRIAETATAATGSGVM